MEDFKKLILDRFQEHLQHNFKNYCRLQGFDDSDNTCLLNFIIDQKLIDLTHIQRYALLQEYEQLNPEQARHKTQTVSMLAHRFSISERTVWSVLKGVRRGK